MLRTYRFRTFSACHQAVQTISYSLFLLPLQRILALRAHLSTTPFKGIVVELFSFSRNLAACYPLHQFLGFNHKPSCKFFLLSQLSQILFQVTVVVLQALGETL